MEDHGSLPHIPRITEWISGQQARRKRVVSKAITFRNLNVHGTTSPTSFQRTFSSYVLLFPAYFSSFFRSKSKSNAKIDILRNLDGLIYGGETVLVLGRPGSGCTTFLKVIAGQDYGLTVKEDALSYNGVGYATFHRNYGNESLYVAESDVHFPELTLKQTLELAAKMRIPRGERTHHASKVAHDIASILNLENSLDTRIGDDIIRGLSGGEKRRASIAEAMISGAQTQCWDNTTRGLDSTTALQIMEFFQKSAMSLDQIILVSLYQAAEEVYALFNKTIILCEGYEIYFGSTKDAVAYFEKIGFVKDTSSTTPDFLTSVTNPAERKMKPGFEERAAWTALDLAEEWRKSNTYRTLQEELDKFQLLANMTQNMISMPSKKPPYAIPIRFQVRACIHRAFQRLRNNLVAPISGIIGNTIVSIIFGSVFYNLSPDTLSFQPRAILIYYVTVLNACTPAFEVLTMWAQRPIVEKHKAYAFSYPISEAIASIIADIPNKILTSLFANASVYFMTNLRREASAFLTFWLFGLAVMLTMSMLFRSVGSLSRTYEETLAPVSMIIFNFQIYAGLVVPPRRMVPWLSWVRWFNPIGYTFESLMINEFSGKDFPCVGTALVPFGSEYEEVGHEAKTCTAIGAIPGREVVEGKAFLIKNYGYQTSDLWRNFGILLGLMLLFFATHLASTEYLHSQKSKGDILLYRRKDQRNKRRARDEECHLPTQVAMSSAERDKEFGGLQGQESIYHWSKVSYDLKTGKGRRRILDGIDGWVRPGTLTALIGVTGAGKTTLLDVLADRKSTGSITGEMLVDGVLRDSGFQRKTGYVQQADLHLDTATVREALNFSAILRRPRSTTSSDKLAYVDTVLSILEMESYADAVVGVPGKGLNIEQRKRLTIAVELVAQPELLLFLDEPTSGLDSQTAWSISQLLRKLANNGQAILCTIHQPSSQLFQTFDQLLVLQEGKTVYFGELGHSASTMISYFERNGARPCLEKENPAAWLLNVIGNLPSPNAAIDWPKKWRASGENARVEQYLKSLSSRRVDASEHRNDTYAAPFWQQLSLVMYRLFQQYWRDPTYLYSKFAVCVSAAFFNGVSFWMVDLDIQGLSSTLFSCFLFAIVFTIIDQQIIPRFSNGSALFEAREHQSRTYSWVVFVTASVIVECTWMSLVSVFAFVSWYYPTGIWKNGDDTFSMSNRAGLSFLLVWFAMLFATTLSQALAAGIRDAQTAVNIAQLLFSLSLVFCGVLVPLDNLPAFWRFVYRASPNTYLISGMISAGIANTNLTCSDIETIPIQLPSSGYSNCAEYLAPFLSTAGGQLLDSASDAQCRYCPVTETNLVLKTLGIDIQAPWRNFGFFSAYIVFNIAATFLLYRLVRVSKAL